MASCQRGSIPLRIIKLSQQGGAPQEPDIACVRAEEALQIVMNYISVILPESKNDVETKLAAEALTRTVPHTLTAEEIESYKVIRFINTLLENVPNSSVVNQKTMAEVGESWRPGLTYERWCLKGRKKENGNPVTEIDKHIGEHTTNTRAFIDSVVIYVDQEMKIIKGKFIFDVSYKIYDEGCASLVGIVFHFDTKMASITRDFSTDGPMPLDSALKEVEEIWEQYEIPPLKFEYMKSFISELAKLAKLQQPGGSLKIIHLLGRRRKIVAQGRKLFVRYNNELIPLTKAKQLDKKKKIK